MPIVNFLNKLTALWGHASTTFTRFFRYFFSGNVTFAVDFAILWFLTEMVGVMYLISATISFAISISIHYLINRRWAFKDTKRGFASGYIYFLGIASMSLILTVWLLAIFVEVFSIHYLTARFLISLLVGVLSFFLNSYLTFNTSDPNGEKLD